MIGRLDSFVAPTRIGRVRVIGSVKSKRINVTLDGEYASKLSRMAERAHVSPGTLARSILSSALDSADPDAGAMTALLDSIPGAFEGLAVAEEQVRKGELIDLDEL